MWIEIFLSTLYAAEVIMSTTNGKSVCLIRLFYSLLEFVDRIMYRELRVIIDTPEIAVFSVHELFYQFDKRSIIRRF